MTRKTRCALAIVVSLAFVDVVRAQSDEHQQNAQKPQKAEARPDRRDHPEPFENVPRYAWWKDDKAKEAAGFSEEQAAQIARIFQEAMEKATPLRKEVMELQRILMQTIEENTADIPVVARQVEKLEARRAELNKMRLVMLYRMQRVLLPEQNTKLLAYFERREAERRKQNDRRDK